MTPHAVSTSERLLTITDLSLDLPTGKRLLDGVTLTVNAGETVGLVGESGSGKSLTSRAVLGLLPPGARMGGSVELDGQEILGATTAELLAARRTSAAMIFQDPRAGINPMRTIGDHLTESLRICLGVSTEQARRQAVELLTAVRLPRAIDHLGQYPHEFSGGMLQRVMIAGALSSSPKLLICDEPTTALDVTTQAEIVSVLQEQRSERGMGMLFITHDLNLAASICDRVYVMRHGQLVEEGTGKEIFQTPAQDYTKQLIEATPSVEVHEATPSVEVHEATPSVEVHEAAIAAGASASASTPESGRTPEPMVVVEGLSKTYHPRGRAAVHAVKNATVSIARGDALGVVGESGSGKSTLARMIIGLEQPDTGTLKIGGKSRETAPRGKRQRIERAKAAQMVFQDPYLSLDPRIAVGRAVEDALTLHTNLSNTARRERVLELLDSVGLPRDLSEAMPRTLSGGQRQRVAIARAIAIEPELLVMDEATSALDVSVQAQVLEMLAEVRREQGLTVLFISHDLGVVRVVCDETVVMRGGEIVEAGPTEQLLGNPQNEYTRLLIDSVPRPAWYENQVA